jgi:hypothetical protein
MDCHQAALDHSNAESSIALLCDAQHPSLGLRQLGYAANASLSNRGSFRAAEHMLAAKLGAGVQKHTFTGTLWVVVLLMTMSLFNVTLFS